MLCLSAAYGLFEPEGVRSRRTRADFASERRKGRQRKKVKEKRAMAPLISLSLLLYTSNISYLYMGAPTSTSFGPPTLDLPTLSFFWRRLCLFCLLCFFWRFLFVLFFPCFFSRHTVNPWQQWEIPKYNGAWAKMTIAPNTCNADTWKLINEVNVPW